jgi:hypothetical protein
MMIAIFIGAAFPVISVQVIGQDDDAEEYRVTRNDLDYSIKRSWLLAV